MLLRNDVEPDGGIKIPRGVGLKRGCVVPGFRLQARAKSRGKDQAAGAIRNVLSCLLKLLKTKDAGGDLAEVLSRWWRLRAGWISS